MLKFDEQKQLDSVNGALALRGRIEEIVDAICAEGYKISVGLALAVHGLLRCRLKYI